MSPILVCVSYSNSIIFQEAFSNQYFILKILHLICIDFVFVNMLSHIVITYFYVLLTGM